MIPQPLCSPRALNKHAQQLFCSLHRRKSEKNQFVAVVVHQLLWQFKRVLSIPVSLHTLVLLFVAQTQLFRDLFRQIFNKFPVVLLRGSAQAVAAHASGQDGMFLAVVVAIDERLTTLYHPVVPSRHRLVVFLCFDPYSVSKRQGSNSILITSKMLMSKFCLSKLALRDSRSGLQC